MQVFGKIVFPMNVVDDQVLIKEDGFPTYHLASIVDDFESNITHIIRGDEWYERKKERKKHLLALGYHPHRNMFF